MEIRDKGVAPSRGLLNQHESLKRFDLVRIAPGASVADIVENYWLVRWDLGEEGEYVQENLPQPSVNMAVDSRAVSGIWGIQTGKWVYRMSGRGALFGTKFRPGAFSALFDRPVEELTDRRVDIETVFDVPHADLEGTFEALNDQRQFGTRMDALIAARATPLSQAARRAGEIVALIDMQADVTSVADVARQSGLGVRSLQRLFETHVGIGPKWVIDRYRMLNAVDALNRGEAPSLTALAHELGYFDQAHFSKRFQALTGMTPSQYRSLGPA